MKNKYIEDNIGIVKSCISKFSYQYCDYDDLFQAGCLGLTKAYKKFDEKRGTKFSSYAVPYILGEIKNYFSESRKIKVSKIINKNYNMISKQKEEFIKIYNREPTLREISEKLGMSIEDIVQALESSQTVISSNEQENNDLLFEESHEKYVSQKIDIQNALKTLDETEQQIVKMRFFDLKTQDYTAKQLNMTQVMISRKEKKILKYLREKLS